LPYPSSGNTVDVPRESGRERQVRLTIYDVRGRLVKTLVDTGLEPGSHRVVWDGRNERGERVLGGMYLYTLRSEDRTFTRKMVLLR